MRIIRSGRNLFNRRSDLAHHGTHHLLVLAFRHHADQGLGARFAHQDAARRAQLGIGGFDAGFDLGVIQRRALLEANIFQDLGQRIVQMRRFGSRLAFLGQHRKHLQRRDQAVAGGGEI